MFKIGQRVSHFVCLVVVVLVQFSLEEFRKVSKNTRNSDVLQLSSLLVEGLHWMLQEVTYALECCLFTYYSVSVCLLKCRHKEYKESSHNLLKVFSCCSG